MEFEFTGEIWHWRGPSPYHYVTIPGGHAAEIQAVAANITYGWGMVRVRVRIGDTEWKTSLFPKDGGYVLPVKDAVRRAEDLELGAVAAVRVTVIDL